MVFFRWFVGLPMAALVTAGLFAFMAGLINMDKGPLPDPVESPELKITADIPPERGRPDRPNRPDRLDEEPPNIEIQRQGPTTAPGPVIDFPENGPVEVDPGRGAQGFPTPTIRVAPPYPENCRSKGAEGQVIAQFDVTPEGSVVNVVIIESPDRCFNRPVIRAVSRWKYPPAYQGNRPVTRYGVVEVFSFQLQE